MLAAQEAELAQQKREADRAARQKEMEREAEEERERMKSMLSMAKV